MSDIKAVVEKVQKLLSLSKSTNANEAAAAAHAANRLIDQYRLSNADLEIESSIQELLEEDEGYIYESGKVTPWKQQLMRRLISHYGLYHWNDTSFATGRQVSRFRLVGRRSDIEIAKYMFAWLTMECQRLSNMEVRGHGRVAVSSYCEGFVKGISDQLSLSREEAKKEATSEAIVRIDARSAEAEKYLYQIRTNLVIAKSKSYRRINPTAFAMGKIRGEEIHLGKSLVTGNVTKLLK